MKTKVISIVLAAALIFCGIPAAAAIGNTESGQDGNGIVARFVLNSDNFVGAHGNVISNPDGSWTLPHADAQTISGMFMSVPVGTYYFKFWLYVERANGVQPDENSRWFFMENGAPVGDVATVNGKVYPDGKWTPMIYKVTVPQTHALQRLGYNLKGPMPWMINNDTIIKIGPEVVVSTNATPDETVIDSVLSYSLGANKAPYNKINPAGGGKSYSTYSHVSATGTKNTTDQSYTRADDKQPIVTFDTNGMYNMGNLAAGTYYFKANTKIGGKDTTKDTSLPVATIYRDGEAVASFPSADEYTANVWKTNVIKFIVPDNSDHTYTISGPQNAASSFSIARNFTIGRTDESPLAMLSTDYKLPMVAASISRGGTINTGKYSYDRELAELTMKSADAADRFVYNVMPLVNDDMNVNAGYVPRNSKIWIKYKAKVSRLAATDAEKTTELLNIEKTEVGVKTSSAVQWNEFTVANQYVTICKEFTIGEANRGSAISVQGNWLGTGQGVDVTVSEVVISTNDDPLPDTTPALSTGIYWPVSQVLPTFAAPSANTIAVNVEDGLWEDKVAIRTIQGIVNKTRPRITVWERGDGTEFTDFEKAQRVYSTELTGTVEGKDCSNVRGRLIYLIWKFRDELDGYNKFSNNNATVNMANTAAYWNNGVPLNQSQIDAVNNAALIGTTLPELINFVQTKYEYTGRGGNALNPGNTNLGTSYSNFYDDYNHLFNPRGVVQLSHEYNDGHTRFRDFVAATGLACIWLDRETIYPAQGNALAKFTGQVKSTNAISTTHAPPVSLGFFPNEGNGVNFTSQEGLVCIPTDHYSNYTHFAGLSRDIDPPSVPAKPELENKRYITMVRSDGDNICTMQGVIKGRMWDQQRRGEYPIGYTMDPAMIDASPQLLQYYYDSATPNDAFVCGPSGLGYTKAIDGSTLWPSGFAQPYAQWTNNYFERTGLNSITYWQRLSNDMRTNIVGNDIFPSILGIFIQTRDNSSSTSDGTYYENSSVPFKVFNSGQHYQTNLANLTTGLNAVQNSAPGTGTTDAVMKDTFHAFQPVLPGFGASDVGTTELYDAMRGVASDNREFVRPDHWWMLMREKRQLSYNVALQRPVSASSYVEGYNPERALDGSFGKTHGWLANSTSGHITVDLGKKMNLERFVVKGGELAGYASVSNPKNFKVTASNDGVNFVDISAQVSNNNAHTYYGDFTIGTTGVANKYRFVRLVVDGTEMARVQEFEVMGFNHTAQVSPEALLYQRGAERFGALTLSEYTNGSAVTAAYNASTAIAGDPSSYTQAQIDTAATNLQSAIDTLAPAIDVTEIKVAINEFNLLPDGLDEEYPAEWADVVSAKDAAKAALAVTEVRPLPLPFSMTQAEIDTVAADLAEAIQLLELAIDVSALKSAIAEADLIVQPGDGKEIYFPGDLAAIEAAKLTANGVVVVAETRPLADTIDATSTLVTTATTALTDAMANLSIKGDINLDKKVDAVDALLALRHSVGVSVLTEAKPLWAGDVNYVSAVNIESSLKILRFVTGVINKFE
jgi:F5/8 type C domain.